MEVGLHAVAGFFGDEGGRDDFTDEALFAQMPAERVAGGTGLVAEAQFHLGMRRLEFFDETVHVLERAADLAVVADLGGVARGDGNAAVFLVDIEADEVEDACHGCWVLVHTCLSLAARKHGSDQTGG
jgi:hypothetical protein